MAVRLAADHIGAAINLTSGLKNPTWADYPDDDRARARDFTWLVAAEKAFEAHAFLTSPEWRDRYCETIKHLNIASDAMKALDAYDAHLALSMALQLLRGKVATV
jgi:hypothetical protein